jgi:Protein of unknown function (DUF3108)
VKNSSRALAVAFTAVAFGASAASADGRLDARYSVSLAGLPIGYGSWTIDVAGDHLTVSANGATSGILRIFASGRGQSTVRAKLGAAGQLVSANYESSIRTDKKYDEVRMLISAGNVKEFTADPPTVASPDRVPLTDAHRRGVSDPMTASLVRVPGTGETVVPQACQRTVSVFDGRMRYDLQLSYKRTDRVPSQTGYDGPVVVCGIRFSPVAGYVPERYAIKYLAQLQDMELWLAPIAGTRIMAPFRLSIPTPVGTGVLEATQFSAIAHPGRASAKSP